MSDSRRRMQEDRAMRAASKALLKADWQMFRSDGKPRQLGSRIASLTGASAKNAANKATSFARDNRGAVAGGAAGLLALAGLAIAAIFHSRKRKEETETVTGALEDQ